MERYDGKARKDDVKRYILIALGVVLLIVLYRLFVYIVVRVSHPTPDMSVVIASTKIIDYSMADEAEACLGPLVGDLDKNGRAVVDVIPLNMAENEGITALGSEGIEVESDRTLLKRYLTEGTYHIFLLGKNGTNPDLPEKFQSIGDSYWRGYCNSKYLRKLPEDLASEDCEYYTEIPGDTIFSETKMSLVTFCGCIHKDATDEEYDEMVALMRKLK